jgi:hypothetical protein
MALRIYIGTVPTDGKGPCTVQAFEGKDDLAAHLNVTLALNVLNKDGRAFTTATVPGLVERANAILNPNGLGMEILTAKEFGQKSYLTPSGRKIPHVSVTYPYSHLV